ncbi:MAG TPA: hypothetical protein DCE03_03435 [Synergistaceae bacterium]|nr:MAG: Uncharacterized protein XE12_0092 [Synergistales bacterium 54_9]MDK2845430.1 hypothetical protein [Synergistales bacterium]HAA47524.1 hypothetical protein [Synergistaceae bacterium]HAG22829.1 hypothetical protein [Synergistaceae bacterium]
MRSGVLYTWETWLIVFMKEKGPFRLKEVVELPEEDEKGKKEKQRSPLTTLLFICVTLAIVMKFLYGLEPVRQFFAGPAKFIFVPILLFLGYLGTKRS